jgi:hypothetical protein
MAAENFEDGKRASVALQLSIVELLNSGTDPRAIALVTTSIGLAMLNEHYNSADSQEIGLGLLERAKEGSLATYPALRAANQNA